MDPEIPELGPGAEPADRPVRGAAHQVSVKGKGWNVTFYKNVPAIPYPIGISSIARNIQPYSGGRVWAEPTNVIPAVNV